MKNLKIVIMAIMLFALVAGTGAALPPPVPQNIPINDTTLYTYTEAQCRNCHDSTTMGGVPTRHHGVISRGVMNDQTGAPYGCMDCHAIVTGPNGQSVDIPRNCKLCHNGTAYNATPEIPNSIKINLSKPHHIDTASDSANIGQPAQTRQCDVCHGGNIDNYNDGHYIPTYATSLMITPFASYKAMNASTGRLWGGCRACHWSNSDNSITTNNNTHHVAIRGSSGGFTLTGKQTQSTPGETCKWCHVDAPNEAGSHGRVNVTINGVVTTVMELTNRSKPGDTLEPGTTNVTLNGTGCEKCHSVATLHNIEFNYAVNNGNAGFGHIGANWDCNGCHASWDAGSQPLGGVIIPNLDSVSPSVLTSGQATVVTLSGNNLVQDTYATKVSVDGTSIDPTTATDTEVVVSVPALAAGVHTIQIVKGDVTSKLSTLTVVGQVAITSAELNGGVITMAGSGFGTANQQFVTIAKADGTISYSDSLTSWSDVGIVATSAAAAAGDVVTVTTPTGSAVATITGVAPTPTPTVTPTPTPAGPTITSAKLKSGVLTVVGTSLETKPTRNAQNYVTTVKSGKTYTASSITSWAATKIVAKVSTTNFKVGQTVTVKTVSGKTASAPITQG